MGDSMKKQTRGMWSYAAGPLLRAVGIGGAMAILFAGPLQSGNLGKALTLFSAGVREPGNAAVLAAKLLRPEETVVCTETAPVAAADGAAEPENEPKSDPDDEPPALTEPTQAAAVPASVSVMAATPPAESGDGGKISEQAVGSGNTNPYGLAWKNRSGTALDVPSALARELTQKFAATDEPQVLIVHTHTTEAYMTYDAGYYNKADRARKTGQEERTVCAAGEALKAQLAELGIVAIHDTTVHDNPKYTGAYSRSEVTVKKYLEQYPSIRVVLDLHRDAIMQGSTTLVKPTVTAGGQKAAQMMIICGVVSTASLPHPLWEQNFALATQWQKALTAAYPGLMRPLSVVASRYNQHLCPGYLLVEVGSEGNTVAEAEYSARLLGKTLADLLKS